MLCIFMQHFSNIKVKASWNDEEEEFIKTNKTLLENTFVKL